MNENCQNSNQFLDSTNSFLNADESGQSSFANLGVSEIYGSIDLNDVNAFAVSNALAYFDNWNQHHRCFPFSTATSVDKNHYSIS